MAHDDIATEKKALQWSDPDCRRCFVPYEHILTWTEEFLFAGFKIRPRNKPRFSDSDPTALMTVQVATEWPSLWEIPSLWCSVPLLLLHFSFTYMSSHFKVNGKNLHVTWLQFLKSCSPCTETDTQCYRISNSWKICCPLLKLHCIE